MIINTENITQREICAAIALLYTLLDKPALDFLQDEALYRFRYGKTYTEYMTELNKKELEND